MSGYTPAFDSIYTGSLYGKWPAAAVWASLLPLADKKGEINMSFEAIAGMTGWPIELLRQGIAELASPDSNSRSPSDEGRRLVPLNAGSGWGWRMVNHALYREKARLMGKNQREVDDGLNASRMKDRRRPPETADDPLSDSYADADPSTSLRSVARARATKYVPETFEVTDEMRQWAAKDCKGVDIDRETAKFRDHKFRDAHSDFVRAWRNWMRRAAEFTGAGKQEKTKFERTQEAMRNGR